MNREAEKTVKVLNRFNRPREKLNGKAYAYYEAVVKTEGILYATDGHILCMVKDTEDILKEGTVCYDVKSRLDHEADVEILKALLKKRSYQKIAEVTPDVSFTVDWDKEVPIPSKLFTAWSNRYYGDKVKIDIDGRELVFDFCGGKDNINGDGVTATYGDMVKDVKDIIRTGATYKEVSFPSWYLFEIMKATKEKTLKVEADTTHYKARITAGKYTFVFTTVR